MIIAYLKSQRWLLGCFVAVIASSCAAIPVPGTALPSMGDAPFPQAQSDQAEPQTATEKTRPFGVVGLMLGTRSLDDDVAWDQIEQPFVLGVEAATFGNPIGFEGGISLAGDSTTVEGVDVSDTFVETYIGARGTFGSGPVFPYIGAGGTLILASVEGDAGGFSVSDDDTTLGFYAHGGVLFRIGTSFFLGLDARLVTGTSLEIFDIDTDADYTQLTAFLGFGR